MIFQYAIVAAYLTILLILMVYCLHRYHILYLYFKNRGKPFVPPKIDAPLPPVTIQLPIYNEMYVIRRLLNAVVTIDYPRQLLDIQVLDDSTDETSHIARPHHARRPDSRVRYPQGRYSQDQSRPLGGGTRTRGRT